MTQCRAGEWGGRTNEHMVNTGKAVVVWSLDELERHPLLKMWDNWDSHILLLGVTSSIPLWNQFLLIDSSCSVMADPGWNCHPFSCSRGGR